LTTQIKITILSQEIKNYDYKTSLEVQEEIGFKNERRI
jgi:hypothetical protein